MKANVVTYHFCNENTNFNGWEKHIGRKNIDEKTRIKNMDEKNTNFDGWKNHTEKTWTKKHKL